MKPEQITAWALDEASAEERLQLEAELRENPTTQKSAEDTKAFCHFLLAELRDDSLALTDAQRERLKLAATKKTSGTPESTMPQTWAATKKTERTPPKWRTSIGLRLGLAACLTVGCVVVWQQYEQKKERREAALAVKLPEPGDAKMTFQVKMPAASMPGMPVPGDLKRLTAAESGNEPLLRDQHPAMPGATAATQPAGIPGLPVTPPPGSPPSVLTAPSTMTVADKAQLGRLQDELTYGVGIDAAKGLLLADASQASGGVGGGTVVNTVARITGPHSATGPVTQVIPGSMMPSGHGNQGTGSILQTEGGIVLGTGTPTTIDGGWAGPPSVMRAPQFGSAAGTGTLNTGNLALVGAASAAASSGDVFKSGVVTLDVGYDSRNNYSGLTKTGAGTVVLAPASPPPVMLGTAPAGQTAAGPMPASIGGNTNHQRTKMLAKVDDRWEEKVPVQTQIMTVTATGNVTAATGDLASTLPINNPSPDASYFKLNGYDPSTRGLKDQTASGVTESQVRNESYQRILENELKDVAREPLSTFSIDVDTAAYANVRRFLNQGMIPPADAVRIEELINYFPAAEEGPAPGAKEPFGVRVEMAPCPWQPQHRLARIAIKGRELGGERKASNLVFLVDVSGSMDEPAKLPLVQRSLRMLTEQLGEGDRVSMVVYAGSSGLALPPTNGEDKQAILAAIDKLKAGGSTHGSAGIYLAYEQAVANFIKDGVNRVILCTDGDFNVGVNSPEELEKLITKKAKSGVFLSVLGFGSGNLKDHTMETLADKGNGNYAYIDSLSEARKVLVEQMSGTLVTIAKDVKIQVEFNPAAVRSYRLVGYENRLMAKEDFNDDTKDAGEIGAAHSVVALYEVVPANLPPGAEPRPLVDNLRYQQNAPSIPPAQLAEAAKSGEVMTVKLRYKEPDSSLSKLIEVPAKDEGKTLTASTEEFKFSAAVAGFGLLLRDSAYKGTLGWETVRKLALDGKGGDKLGYRGEFLQLIDKARGLKETRE